MGKKAAIKVVSRTANKSAPGNTKFPEGLSQARYVEIKIFDTAKGDANKELAQAAGGGVAALGVAFQNVSGKNSAGDIVDNLKEVGSAENAADIAKDVWKRAESAWDKAKADWEKYAGEWSNVGNPALKETFKDSIFLPLPNELEEALSHEYNENGGSLFSQVPGVNAAVEGAQGIISYPSNIYSIMSGRQALIANANKLIKFTGSAFREITLNWTLVPNNKAESDNLHELITKLKAYSSPQHVSGKLLLRTPFFARLHFTNEIINNALQFKEVVMTAISVNYSPTGNMNTFYDDRPKSVNLSITFKDREPKTLQDWSKGMAEPGYEWVSGGSGGSGGSSSSGYAAGDLNNPNSSGADDGIDYGG